MSSQSHLEWVRPPLQARSQRTLERLLDAAEELICTRGVEAASVQAVTRGARSSVGAFYARFEDKDALLRAVFQRFAEQAQLTIDAALEPSRWQGRSVEEIVLTTARFLLLTTRERRGLIAALALRACGDPEASALLDGLAEHVAKGLGHLLESRGALEESASPERVRFVATLAMSLTTSRLLRPMDRPDVLDDELIARELTHVLIRTVTGGSAWTERPRSKIAKGVHNGSHRGA